MNSKTLKRFQPFLLKIAIIAMSICYVLGPAHNEINKLLHVLAHQLDMPEMVLSHSKIIHLEYEIHNNHHFSSNQKENHDHNFLEFIDGILKSSDAQKKNENTIIDSNKLDKHIRTKDFYNGQKILQHYNLHKFIIVYKKPFKGFLKGVFQPPKSIVTSY